MSTAHATTDPAQKITAATAALRTVRPGDGTVEGARWFDLSNMAFRILRESAFR
jgi:hypothetical protein